jgi:hypothetical protein
MSDTIATKAAAEHCDTTPRQLRQFLRASKDYEAVGSGGRYAFESDDLPELKTRFDAWVAEREAAAKARAEKEAAQDESQPDDKNGDMHADEKNDPKPARGRKPAAA